MIGFLRGNVAGIYSGRVVIDVNGVGYNVLMPESSLAALPGLNESVKVFTHLSVREDAMTLYGFLTADDLELFRMLIGVSGVGPKFALGVLSTFTVSELRFAVLSQDAKTISKAPGIGLKSAQKIILELKDKISFEDVCVLPEDNGSTAPSNNARSEAMIDAQEALVALGYSASDALRAVRDCGCSVDDDVETVIKAALKVMKR